jgi:hypothetical protein
MRPGLVCAALAATTALLSGCGSSGASPSSSGSTHSTAPPASTNSRSGYSKDRGNAQFAMGATVVISNTGFQPKILLAPMGVPIVWRNTSAKTQSVHLDNFGTKVDSGPIKPGTTWSFNPKAEISILYHSTYDSSFRGQLQVQPIGNS